MQKKKLWKAKKPEKIFPVVHKNCISGAYPICAAWEGVIVSVSGDNPDYPSLLDAENDGCFHPRCLHGISTYYPGISHAPEGGFRNEPREIEQPSRQYTARSKQRYSALRKGVNVLEARLPSHPLTRK